MRGLRAAAVRILPCAVVALVWPIAATAALQDLALDDGLLLDSIFSDGFESGECATWSATWNPLGAPDFDLDTFGDATQPTVYCQLPDGFVPNATDCNDDDAFVHPGAAELCNGVDDDCNANSPDGGADPLVGFLCDGADSDLCDEGVTECVAATIACGDATGSTVDLCNGADDDCDVGSADGSEDPQIGVSCDGTDSDLCIEGTKSCSAGSLVCSDATSSTVDLCNGADDDCDAASADGSEDPLYGTSCDGPDSDLCAEGTRSCSAGSLVCSDATGSTVDVCNGADDDCDAASADGSEDPQIGVSCDGPDSDRCIEGTKSCSAGSLVCSDATSSTVDLCNGADDDCDAASADGSEDPQIGVSCDGPDSDLCAEGTKSCPSGSLVCSDATSSTTDICNGADDDCDAASADGSEDPQIGVSCDGADGDECLEGVKSCPAGSLVCSDQTGTTIEICNGLDDDCDGATDEGCPFRW